MPRANNKPLLVALLAMAALSAVATEVAAHARVKRASPAVGGAVTASAAPTELQVWFTEALAPALSTIEVVDRAGTRMDRGDVRIRPRRSYAASRHTAAAAAGAVPRDLARRLDRHSFQERLVPVPGRSMILRRIDPESSSASC